VSRARPSESKPQLSVEELVSEAKAASDASDEHEPPAARDKVTEAVAIEYPLPEKWD
jgi:hypothetical protein